MPAFACQSRLRYWTLRLASLLVGLIAAFIAAEITLRAFAPQGLTPLLAWAETPGFEGLIVADDELGWRMAAGYDGEFAKETHVAINSIGLRDHEYADKQPNEMRVLSLGDSYAFGHGVEHEEIYVRTSRASAQARLCN